MSQGMVNATELYGQISWGKAAFPIILNFIFSGNKKY